MIPFILRAELTHLGSCCVRFIRDVILAEFSASITVSIFKLRSVWRYCGRGRANWLMMLWLAGIHALAIGHCSSQHASQPVSQSVGSQGDMLRSVGNITSEL